MLQYNYILGAALDGGTQVRFSPPLSEHEANHHLGIGHGLHPLLRRARRER